MMILVADSADAGSWDEYILNNKESTVYHLFGWKQIIESVYSHKTHYLVARQEVIDNSGGSQTSIAGVLPLVHLQHFFFGNKLVSMPFMDMGGLLADNSQVEDALLSEAVKLGRLLKADHIELRHQRLSYLFFENLPGKLSCTTSSDKVRMLLALPENSELLMKSFKAKLRSQIKKPIKEGLTVKVGGCELLGHFYKVFAVNMRDLGSPVHSSELFNSIFNEFKDKVKIVVVYKEKEPLAVSLVIKFKNILCNPWASSLREYSKLSPNMLLYWKMLEYASENGCGFFDFGRSTPGAGTSRFKEQWGAKPYPLNWHFISLREKLSAVDDANVDNAKSEPANSGNHEGLRKGVEYWQKLPVAITKIIGPLIRKHIDL